MEKMQENVKILSCDENKDTKYLQPQAEKTAIPKLVFLKLYTQ